MSDLQNDFPSWGETGALPSSGFFYEGGDQVNEKHLDALWHNVKTHFDLTHTAIRDRVREIEGDTILDSGLVTSTTGNTREIAVSASSAGAYVDGQRTGSTSKTTITLSSNGGSSTRTDSIWVDTNGQVGATEGTTSVSDGKMKVAEVDVSSSDTISGVRNTGRDRVRSFAAENPDSGQVPGGFLPGDIWYDHTADKLKSRINGAWRPLLSADGSQPMVGNLDLGGNALTDGDGTVNVNTATSINGAMDLSGDIATSGGTTIWDSTNGYVPASSVEDVWVNANGDTMSGILDTGGNDIEDGTTTIWDSSNGYIPQSSVQQGSGSGFNADKVDGKEGSELGASTGEKALWYAGL